MIYRRLKGSAPSHARPHHENPGVETAAGPSLRAKFLTNEHERNRDAAFKARVALGAVKGERTVSELAAEYGVDPTMIHQWKRSLLEGAAGIFERGGKAAMAAEVAEETVRDLHAKIGELAVANDFLSRKLKPWIGK